MFNKKRGSYSPFRLFITYLKTIDMDAETLIKVIAKIDARIDAYKNADENDPYYKGSRDALISLGIELQKGIDSTGGE
jgi:hypothetical protein